MTLIKSLIGNKFTRLLVIELASKNPVKWKCQCDCGNITFVSTYCLKSGNSKSCNCLRNERNKKGAPAKHGHSHSKIYKTHESMLERCYKPKHKSYHYYGGRGITVCDRWRGKDGFINFLADMGERPDGKTLDRWPDNNGNYEPSNCRWATIFEQRANRRPYPKHIKQPSRKANSAPQLQF